MSGKHVFLLMTTVLFPLMVLSQTKYEKEVRIQRENVPESALSYVDKFQFSRKIRWYKEYGLETTTVEAKTKSNGKKFSIEFSQEGLLEDVEIDIKFKTSPDKVKRGVTSYLEENFTKWRVEKIQRQFSGDPIKIFDHLTSNAPLEDVTVKYELVIQSRTQGSYKKYELLFSNQGELLSKKEIIEKNTINIEY